MTPALTLPTWTEGSRGSLQALGPQGRCVAPAASDHLQWLLERARGSTGRCPPQLTHNRLLGYRSEPPTTPSPRAQQLARAAHRTQQSTVLTTSTFLGRTRLSRWTRCPGRGCPRAPRPPGLHPPAPLLCTSVLRLFMEVPQRTKPWTPTQQAAPPPQRFTPPISRLVQPQGAFPRSSH